MSSGSVSTATEGEGGEKIIPLYERWKKIQTLWVDGRFQRARRAMLLVLLLIFYLGPWITWNGHPAIHLDLPGRKFTIFAFTFWPQEFVLLSMVMVIAAFTLFVFTVLAGRLFCGYSCPQTVWTLVYVWIEKLIEGDRSARLKLDRGKWSLRKVRIKGLKYALWLAIAFSISITLVGYFTPIRELLPRVGAFQLSGWELFFVYFFAGASYLFHGVLREQVCLHMCPYARFQSAMFDRDTLIVAYNKQRGEPRGSRSRKADPGAMGLGSCIDCGLCVQACPTGIDIRDGLQYECIGCAQCLDACDGIMQKMGYEPGLIRYSSENIDEGQPVSWKRPRLYGYGAVLCAMLAVLVTTVGTRVPLGLDVIRDRNRLYRERWDGTVENVYTLRIMNREQVERTYRIVPLTDFEMEFLGEEVVTVAAGQQRSLPVSLFAQESVGDGPNFEIGFKVETVDEPTHSARAESRFLKPARKPSS